MVRKAPDAFGCLPTELFDQIVANAKTDGMLGVEDLERARDELDKERWENMKMTAENVGFHWFCHDWDHIVDWRVG